MKLYEKPLIYPMGITVELGLLTSSGEQAASVNIDADVDDFVTFDSSYTFGIDLQ